jgi:hypothetical protein
MPGPIASERNSEKVYIKRVWGLQPNEAVINEHRKKAIETTRMSVVVGRPQLTSEDPLICLGSKRVFFTSNSNPSLVDPINTKLGYPFVDSTSHNTHEWRHSTHDSINARNHKINENKIKTTINMSRP